MSKKALTQSERELLEIINNHPNKEFAILKAIEIVSEFLENDK
jgi:hypothetical protein